MIGVIAHAGKKGVRRLTHRILEEFRRRGVEFLLEIQTAEIMGLPGGVDEAALTRQCDLLVVLGGDGTILRVVHCLEDVILPIFGINIGSLGFLTGVGPADYLRAVECISEGTFVTSPRSLLMAELSRDGKTLQCLHGLNDVVVSRGERSQLVMAEVRIDGVVLTTYNADGLIMATPTGSTAYSLSAGGPILMPDSGGFVITPICPHVLTNRSTVVSDTSVIEVRLTDRRQDVFVNVDGRSSYEMQAGDVLRVVKSPRVLPLSTLPDRPFSEVLREKLKWSGSNI